MCADTFFWSTAVEEIGKNLQRQFETLSQKVKYKLVSGPPLPLSTVSLSSFLSLSLQYLDPAFEDTKKLCHQLRKTAKDERLLFYYNGHGVSSLYRSLPLFRSSLTPMLLAARYLHQQRAERFGSLTGTTLSTSPSACMTFRSGSEGELRHHLASPSPCLSLADFRPPSLVLAFSFGIRQQQETSSTTSTAGQSVETPRPPKQPLPTRIRTPLLLPPRCATASSSPPAVPTRPSP